MVSIHHQSIEAPHGIGIGIERLKYQRVNRRADGSFSRLFRNAGALIHPSICPHSDVDHLLPKVIGSFGLLAYANWTCDTSIEYRVSDTIPAS